MNPFTRRTAGLLFVAMAASATIFAQVSNRDAAMLKAALDANPPGYSVSVEGPAELPQSGPLEVATVYRQPEPVRVPVGHFPLGDFILNGFVLRGPVACGFPELLCPTPEMRRNPETSRAVLRMATTPSGSSLDLRRLLPALPPGDYTLYAVMVKMERVETPTPGEKRFGVYASARPAEPKSILISEPYRFRIIPSGDAGP